MYSKTPSGKSPKGSVQVINSHGQLCCAAGNAYNFDFALVANVIAYRSDSQILYPIANWLK